MELRDLKKKEEDAKIDKCEVDGSWTELLTSRCTLGNGPIWQVRAKHQPFLIAWRHVFDGA